MQLADVPENQFEAELAEPQVPQPRFSDLAERHDSDRVRISDRKRAPNFREVR